MSNPQDDHVSHPPNNVGQQHIGSNASSSNSSTNKVFQPSEKDTVTIITPENARPTPQSAYDPSTGAINWDCPCLGNMTQPPCGDAFKDAFSCFVFSETDPKGKDCLEKFRVMQDCFREHPEIYEDMLDGDDEGEEDDGDKPKQDQVIEAGEWTGTSSMDARTEGEGVGIAPVETQGGLDNSVAIRQAAGTEDSNS